MPRISMAGNQRKSKRSVVLLGGVYGLNLLSLWIQIESQSSAYVKLVINVMYRANDTMETCAGWELATMNTFVEKNKYLKK